MTTYHAPETYFVFNPADDGSVDSEWLVIGHQHVSIQVSPYARNKGGEFTVNELVDDDDDIAIQHHLRTDSLTDAMLKALEVAGIQAAR